VHRHVINLHVHREFFSGQNMLRCLPDSLPQRLFYLVVRGQYQTKTLILLVQLGGLEPRHPDPQSGEL
jgi:hypothetical protein